jgi:hypothetical protein
MKRSSIAIGSASANAATCHGWGANDARNATRRSTAVGRTTVRVSNLNVRFSATSL